MTQIKAFAWIVLWMGLAVLLWTWAKEANGLDLPDRAANRPAYAAPAPDLPAAVAPTR